MRDVEILIPIWALKEIVEREHEDWMFFNAPDKLKPEEKAEIFPLTDSTKSIIETLEEYGILFDFVKGEWL